MKSTKKVMMAVLFVLAAGTGILFAGGKGQQTGASAANRVLKWTNSATPEHIHTQSCDAIIKDIFDQTGIQIQNYPSAQLAGDVDGIDLVRSGGADFITVGIHGFSQFAEELQGCMMPFSFENSEVALDFFIEYVMPEYMNHPDRVKAMNMYTLAIFDGGTRHTTTKGIPLRNPSQLAGQKVRSMEPPMAIATVKALGGSPVPVAFAELYMALQTGTAIAQENPLMNIMSTKMYEVQDYLILTEHAINMNMVFVNKQVWESFTESQRQTIQGIVTRVQGVNNERIKASQEELVKQLEGQGMTVIRDIDKQAFIDNAARVIAEDFKDARYDSWRAMRQYAFDWIAAHK